MRSFAVRFGAVSALLACLGMTGCAGFGLRNGEFVSKQHEPKVEDEEDRWGLVGKEGRGNRPLDDEHDPFKPILMSKEAQNIERNLGYK